MKVRCAKIKHIHKLLSNIFNIFCLLFQYVFYLMQEKDKEHANYQQGWDLRIQMNSISSADGNSVVMDNLLQNQSFQDFELVSSDRKVFQCHKNILAGEFYCYH